LERPWLTRLNPLNLLHRWFTVVAFIWFAGTTTLLLLAFVRDGAKVSAFFAIYLLLTVVCSVIAFILYGIDKRRAIKSRPRISERTLHIFSILGGWPGAQLGQRLFRHKTLKISFRLVFWLIVTVHLLIIIYGIWSGWPITAVRTLLGV
jgi:uncharacterized membrane protein YsdA (DUF1294 family)